MGSLCARLRHNDPEGSVVYDDVQEGRVNLQLAVIFDEAELAESVHEEIHPRAGGADPGRQNLLSVLGDGLHLALLAEVGEEQEQPGEPLLARIEQLIDQIRFDLNIAGQQERHEKLGEGRFLAQHADHGRFVDSGDGGLNRRGCRRDMQRLAGQASLAKKFPAPQHGDHGFLALLGDDRDLHLALLDIENRIGPVSLQEDGFSRLVGPHGSSRPYRREERAGVETLSRRARQIYPPSSAEAGWPDRARARECLRGSSPRDPVGLRGAWQRLLYTFYCTPSDDGTHPRQQEYDLARGLTSAFHQSKL